jgi:hypothetical protein
MMSSFGKGNLRRDAGKGFQFSTREGSEVAWTFVLYEQFPWWMFDRRARRLVRLSSLSVLTVWWRAPAAKSVENVGVYKCELVTAALLRDCCWL